MLRGQQKVETGGIVWAYRLVLNGKLFDTEGVWLPTRLITFQCAQVLIAAFLVFAFVLITQTAANEAEKAQGSAENQDLPQVGAWDCRYRCQLFFMSLVISLASIPSPPNESVGSRYHSD